MENSRKKYVKMVTLLDIITSIKTQEAFEVFVRKTGLQEEVANSMFDLASDLGYVSEEDKLTEAGEQYYADCMDNTPEVYGTLTLVRGLPGAGKTTLAQTLVNEKILMGNSKIVHLESDQFMVDENGEYKFQIGKVKATNVECIAQTERYLRMGYDVVVSNAFVQYWELKPYYDIAASLNIKTLLVEVQGQFQSERRSARTRQQMVEKWDAVFLPRAWVSHTRDRQVDTTEVLENDTHTG